MSEDDFNSIAWRDFILFAARDPECMAAFNAETGLTFAAPKNPISLLVDNATGVNRDVAIKFVEWVTVNHWGVEYAPKAYRDLMTPHHPTDRREG